MPIDLNFENPVKRTSVTIPNNGYVIIRFKANNPGTDQRTLRLTQDFWFSVLVHGRVIPAPSILETRSVDLSLPHG